MWRPKLRQTKKAWWSLEMVENCTHFENFCTHVAKTKFGKIASIEGNIGTGKSSLLDHIVDKGISVQTEPIGAWGVWLKLLYEDMKKQILGFQFQILMSYYHILANLPITDNLVIKRTPYTTWNIFSKDSDNLDGHEKELLLEYFNELGWQPNYWIYRSFRSPLTL